MIDIKTSFKRLGNNHLITCGLPALDQTGKMEKRKIVIQAFDQM